MTDTTDVCCFLCEQSTCSSDPRTLMIKFESSGHPGTMAFYVCPECAFDVARDAVGWKFNSMYERRKEAGQ